MLKNEKDAHDKDECVFRQVSCKAERPRVDQRTVDSSVVDFFGCGTLMEFQQLKAHKEDSCDLRPWFCNQCEKYCQYRNRKIHIDDVCPETILTCKKCSAYWASKAEQTLAKNFYIRYFCLIKRKCCNSS